MEDEMVVLSFLSDAFVSIMVGMPMDGVGMRGSRVWAFLSFSSYGIRYLENKILRFIEQLRERLQRFFSGLF